MFFYYQKEGCVLSATFWIRRKKKAAELAKEQAAKEAAAPDKVEPVEGEVKKPKKGVKKNEK